MEAFKLHVDKEDDFDNYEIHSCIKGFNELCGIHLRGEYILDRRIYLLTAVAFGVGMVELIIGGILDLVALDLQVTEGKAGLLITIFAFSFALSGPVLLYMTRNFGRKRVTLVALLVFFIGNLIVIMTNTYSMVMLSRIITAASGSLLVVLCLTLASHISTPAYRGRAIGLVVMGISGSVVLGLPIGVSLGQAFGWRSPFILIALLTVILAISVHLFFGHVPTHPMISLREQIQTLGNRRILFAHLTTFFFLAGHFTLYGFLTPFVQTIFGFEGVLITIVYFIYGAAAVTGGGLAGWTADHIGIRQTLMIAIVLLGFSLLVLPFTPQGLFWPILVLWGILSWAITPPVQSHLIRLTPETADIQQSLNNTALHLGIAFGTFLGSIIIDQFNVKLNPFFGIIFVILSFMTASISLKEEQLST